MDNYYGHHIWKKYITILENVQCWPKKLVDGFHHMSYSERLKKLILPHYLKISDLETVLVENKTTNWYGKH